MLFKIISLSFWNYNINASFSLHFLSSNPAIHPCLFKFMTFFSVIVLYTHTHILIHTHRISQSYNLFSLYNTTCILVFRAVHWLALNKFVFSSLEKAISPSLSITVLLAVLCGWLKPPGLSSIHVCMPIVILVQFTSSHLPGTL